MADSRTEARKMQEESEVYIVVPESEEVLQNWWGHVKKTQEVTWGSSPGQSSGKPQNK